MSGPPALGSVRPLADRLPARPSGGAVDARDGTSGEHGVAAVAGVAALGVVGPDTGSPSPGDGSPGERPLDGGADVFEATGDAVPSSGGEVPLAASEASGGETTSVLVAIALDAPEDAGAASVGVALDTVADVLRFSEIRLGWNLWFYQHQEVSVLFADGSGYDGLDLPLESFDVERARRETPERWFVWRETDDGGRERRAAAADEDAPWRSVRGRSILEREPAPRTLELTVATTRTDGIWTMGGTTRTSGYRFFAGGRFERFLRLLHESDAGGEDRQRVAVHRDAGGARIVAAVDAPLGEGSANLTTRRGSAGGPATDDVTDASAEEETADRQGDLTDASADGATGDGGRDVATVGGDPALRGRYEIRGNTLVLHFDDGRTRAELFADLGNGALMIGDRLHV